MRALAELAAAVVLAVVDHRPAVVQSGLGDVDLVAALRRVLVDPQLAGLGVQRRALRVAVAVGPDLGPAAVDADEGVVGGDRAVRIDANHVAPVDLEVLRALALAAVADRDEQRAVAREHQPRPEVPAAAGLRLLAEDHLDAAQAQLVPVEARAGHGGAGAAVPGLGVGQVDQAVVGVAGIERDVQQAPLADVGDVRHAAHRLGHRAVGRHHAQSARLLGHQRVAVRQEGQAPGLAQAVGHGRHAHLAVLGGEGLLGIGGAAAGQRDERQGGERGRGLVDHRNAGHGRVFPSCSCPSGAASPAGAGARSRNVSTR